MKDRHGSIAQTSIKLSAVKEKNALFTENTATFPPLHNEKVCPHQISTRSKHSHFRLGKWGLNNQFINIDPTKTKILTCTSFHLYTFEGEGRGREGGGKEGCFTWRYSPLPISSTFALPGTYGIGALARTPLDHAAFDVVGIVGTEGSFV